MLLQGSWQGFPEFAAVKDQYLRNAKDVEPGGDTRALIHVHLRYPHPAFGFSREIVDDGKKGCTRRAPGRPGKKKQGQGRLGDEGLEIRIRDGKRLMEE